MPLDVRFERALLLQGPVGPFFRRFAEDLRRRGVHVTKVNFNAGDALFYPGWRDPDVIAYRGALSDWPAALARLVDARRIDAIFLFGDCRPIHVPAVALARARGIPVWVFEEGYLRPSYVTMEPGGVNGNSSLPRDPDVYRRAAATLPPGDPPVPIDGAFAIHAVWTALHSVAATLLFWMYPRYRHHRTINCFYQAFAWARGAVRKYRCRFAERGVLDRLVRDHAGRYWVVPLQVHCDAQLLHSPYASMEAFMEEVVAAFAAHAARDEILVVKHHPHDLPYRDYARFLRRLGRAHGCADRIVYVHDVHLPTLLRHARGCVTMNSTVGTSALHHRTPCKVMGNAIYDVPGMTSQQPLAEFLRAPDGVDGELYEGFIRYLRAANQVNGSFYKRLRAFGTASGLDPAVFGVLGPARPDPTALRAGEPA